MDKVKIGIVGTGYIGNVHGRIYSRDERTEIAALYDIVPERAVRTAKSIGGKVCSSRDELMENCDAVLVCSPNKTHKEIALHAIADGKKEKKQSKVLAAKPRQEKAIPLSEDEEMNHFNN